MADGITVKINVNKALTDKLKALESPVDSSTAQQMGQATVEAMQEMIASGVSPIKGKGRFPAYKNPKSYPGSKKPKSPVNLRLRGDFLDSLTSSVKSDGGEKVAVVSYPSDQADKERGHREGANAQPKRPTLPVKGETFAEKVQAAYLKVLQARVDKLTK